MQHSLCLDILDCIYDGVYIVNLDRKIIYWNKGAERISGYSPETVMGSHCYDNLLMHVNDLGDTLCTGLCPLAKTLVDGAIRETEIYLHHQQGHRVPVRVRILPIVDSAGSVVGAVEVFTDNIQKSDLLKQLEHIHKISLTDALTQIGNRRYAEMQVESRLKEVTRNGVPSFAIQFIDIDHFKRVNDTYGHNTGDEVLKMIARTLTNALQQDGAVCRWGGEEFIAIITTNNEEDLLYQANKLRFLIEQSHFQCQDNQIRITVSVGATLAHAGDTMESLIERADRLMYQSKQQGRNRVSIRLESPASCA